MARAGATSSFQSIRLGWKPTNTGSASSEGDSERRGFEIGSAAMTPASPHLSVSLDDVMAARERIAPWVRRTPVLTSHAIDERLGCSAFFKCEMFQRTGAFKARGAFSRLTQLTPEERSRG